MNGWVKKETYHKTEWSAPELPSIKVTVRLNDVTRKYQVYATDGDMEIADLGTFGLRQEEQANQKAAQWMERFSFHSYMTTGRP